MKLASFIAVSVLLTPSLATAQDTPTMGQVVDEKESSSLTYECAPVGEQLRCSFVQVLISKKTPETNAELSARAGELVKTPIGPADCTQYKEALERIRGGGDYGIPLGPMERQDAIDMMGVLVNFCDSPNAATALATLGALQAKDNRTCNVATFRFELTFTFDPVRNRWEAVTPPTGPCGVVTAASLEPETTEGLADYPFWNYRQQKIVTKRDGQDPLFGQCKEWPESENSSNWRGRVLPLQCDYIKFGIF